MADLDQLPRLPVMTYRPEEDIPATNPRRMNRYIQGIESATGRLDLLTQYLKYLSSEKYGPLSTCIELASSIKHHLQMFKSINVSIKNPSDIVKENIRYINDIEQRLSAIILFKSLPGNGAEVPSISPYELAIRIIIDNCTRAEQFEGAKDLMS